MAMIIESQLFLIPRVISYSMIHEIPRVVNPSSSTKLTSLYIFGGKEFKIEIDSSIWREGIQNRKNRLLDLAGSLVLVRNGGKRKVVLASRMAYLEMHDVYDTLPMTGGWRAVMIILLIHQYPRLHQQLQSESYSESYSS